MSAPEIAAEPKRATEVGRAPDGSLEGLALWGFLGLTLAASLGWVLWLLE